MNSLFSFGDEVMEGICQISQEIFVDGFNFSLMTADDMEFVKVFREDMSGTTNSTWFCMGSRCHQECCGAR